MSCFPNSFNRMLLIWRTSTAKEVFSLPWIDDLQIFFVFLQCINSTQQELLDPTVLIITTFPNVVHIISSSTKQVNFLPLVSHPSSPLMSLRIAPLVYAGGHRHSTNYWDEVLFGSQLVGDPAPKYHFRSSFLGHCCCHYLRSGSLGNRCYGEDWVPNVYWGVLLETTHRK